MSPTENLEAIEIPFAFRTRMKDLLHIADRLGANNVLCLFNTIQPSSFDRYILLCKTQRSNIKAVQQSVNTLIILLINKANIFIKDLT